MIPRILALSFFGPAVAALALVGPDDAPKADPKPAPAAIPDANPGDVGSIDEIVDALYDVISGPKGRPRDWDRLRSLFDPEARLIAVVDHRDGKAASRVFRVDEFIEIAGDAFEGDGFYEREIARETDRFGHMAHLMSTYEVRRAKDEDPFMRGINSIQLFFDGDRWWVLTIYWDSEREGSPIPREYLPEP